LASAITSPIVKPVAQLVPEKVTFMRHVLEQLNLETSRAPDL
jgi:hypothetical protein